jgi:uncharacterized RDD family membrane protein YckC
MYQENESEVLTDIEQAIYMDPVSKGVRFTNYVIDLISLCALIFGVFIIWAMINYAHFEQFVANLRQDTLSAKLWQIIMNVVITCGYYTVFETATRGRTIGKLVTGSIAVTEDGNPLTFKTAFLRSICRLIPFNAFSALGNRPWHDSLSKTTVIKKTW